MKKTQRWVGTLRTALCAAIFSGIIAIPGDFVRAAIINADIGDQFILADLIESQDAILIGDKKFDLWGYVKEGLNNNMPDADAVTIITTIIDGNLGITLQGGFGDVPGDNGFSDASLFYRVMVTDENNWISDAHLGGNLDIVGSPDATGTISVTEDFFVDDNGNMGAFLGQISITAAQANGEQFNVQDAWIFFDELQKSLFIRKDIIAFAEEGLSFPIASLIDQTFSQIEIPEPATLSLLIMASLFTCAGCRRRRRHG